MQELEELLNKYKEIEGWRTQVNGVLKELNGAFTEVMNVVNTLEHNVNQLAQIECVIQDNLKYEMNDPRNKVEDLFYPIIKEQDDTLDLIIRERKSLARFGDGEFALMAGKERCKYQHCNERLAQKLCEVIQSDNENILIGIADNYGNLDKYNFHAANQIRFYMTQENRRIHQNFLRKDKIYHDTYLTRPYVMYEDRFTDAPKMRFEKLKKIWEGRNVILIEGAQTRFGAGNDFLSGALSVRRVLGPAVNSFDKYDEILESVLAIAQADDLCLIAMGPCAGAMAYDLCVAGIQAIDIGHADLEYEWFRAGKGVRVSVPYKYNNELPGGEQVQEYTDPLYDSQIVIRHDK